MKLTFSTLGAPELGFDEILALASSYGFAELELRGILGDVAIDSLPILLPQNRAETARRLADVGIGIRVLGCSASFHGANHTTPIAECAYAIEAARELGVPYIRVFGDRCPDEAAFDRVVCGLKKACELAPGSGVAVLIEAHGDFNTSERLSRLLDSVGCDELGVIWDVEHTHLAGEDSGSFLEKLSGRIKHVHFKDVRADGTLCLPGEGVIKLREIADVLEMHGYDGYISLEWEKRWHPELASIETALDRFVKVLS